VSAVKKALMAVIVALILVAAAGWFWVRQSGLLEQAADIAENVDVDVSMQGLTLTQGEEGAMRWKLEAKNATYLQEEGRVQVDEPLITYYRDASDDVITVRAPKGEVDQNTEQAWLWPEVDMQSGQSAVRADKLHYTGSDRTIVLTGQVVLTRPDMQVFAEKAVVELESSGISATGGVKALIRRSTGIDAQKEQ